MVPPIPIPGIGTISAAGADLASTLETFESQKRNIAGTLPFTSTIVAPTLQVFADLPELSGRANHSRSVRLAMAAVQQAMAQAGIARFAASDRVGVCLGTTVASQLNNIPFYEAYRRDGHPPLDAVYNYLNANLATAVGELLGVNGPRLTIVNACSSGADAIGVAASWIRAGLCDFALAGGADELNRVALAGFWSLGVMSAEPCRPFDRDRAGLNLGEGAGVLLLESGQHIRQRGAKSQFELAGFGAACDAHHLTAPHPQGRGLETAIHTAMTQANLTPERIAFINAHGTATIDNDRAESNVLSNVFGSIPFLSTKGHTGHTLGAAGGLEAVFTILGLQQGWIPASIGFSERGEDVAVPPVQERTPIAGEYALSTSLAFGGNNAAVILRRVS